MNRSRRAGVIGLAAVNRNRRVGGLGLAVAICLTGVVGMAAVSVAAAAPGPMAAGRAAAHRAGPNPGCARFRWDIARERALFATPGEHAVAGRNAASAPLMRPDRLYVLSLSPQQDVHFVRLPEKRGLSDGAYAGLMRLRVPAAGLYRVSLDRPFWIDVVSKHGFIESSDFAGQPGCGAPHKIVLFPLAAGTLVLQLSGDVSPRVRVTLTRAPRSKSSK